MLQDIAAVASVATVMGGLWAGVFGFVGFLAGVAWRWVVLAARVGGALGFALGIALCLRLIAQAG